MLRLLWMPRSSQSLWLLRLPLLWLLWLLQLLWMLGIRMLWMLGWVRRGRCALGGAGGQEKRGARERRWRSDASGPGHHSRKSACRRQIDGGRLGHKVNRSNPSIHFAGPGTGSRLLLQFDS